MERLRESFPVAKKNHTCNWCKHTIKQGEQYHYQVLKDSDIYTWKSHYRCAEVAQYILYFFNLDEMTHSDFIGGCFNLLSNYIYPNMDKDLLWSELLSNTEKYVDKLYQIYVEKGKDEKKEESSKNNWC